MMGHYQSLANTRSLDILPKVFWILLGVIQIILATCLLISIKKGKAHRLAVPSAIGLAITSLLGIFIYTAYTGFPGILWALIPAALFAFVAYKRKPNLQ